MSSYLYDRSVRGYRLLTPPSVEPITVDFAKKHLRVEATNTDDDEYIALMLKATRAYAENYTRRALCAQQWQLTLDRFPVWGDGDDPYFWLYRRGIVDLVKPPLRSVDSISYVQQDGTVATLVEGTDFVSDIQDAYARLEPVYGTFWPITQFRIASVNIVHTSGYTAEEGDPNSEVPADIKAAMLLILGALYENREDVSAMQSFQLPWGAENLLSPYRAVRFG